jgi:ATP-dependent RNA helicase DeaD
MRVLKKGVHIVVGTPGRLNDHLQRGSLSLKTASIVVLDEADIMLDMGFKDEVEEILAHTPAQRQLWLFSATTKDGVSSIIKSMRSPVTVRIAPSAASTPKTLQYYCIAPRTARFEALCAFIEQAEEFYGIVFCRTKASTQEIADRLVRRGLDAKALHGDMAQGARNRVIEEFKRRGASILVATDVAARGIDVSDLTHVINYSLPDDPESYVHRVGRTGRAGKEGMAITMIGHQEIGEIKRLARRFNMTITALEVPCSDTMLQKRLDSALAYTGATKSAVAQNPQVEALQKHLAGRSAEELVSITTRLLVEKFLTLHVNHPSEEGDVSDARDGGRGGDADRGFAPRRSGGGRSGGGRFGGRGRSGGGSGGFRREGGSSSSNAGGSFKPRRKF